MKVPEKILNILGECSIQSNPVYLPQIQLERKAYQDVNKCLESIGGKWNRKAKGHVFDSDPADLLDNLILTGETFDLKKEFQFFPTPRTVAELMCDLAEIKVNSFVLEPSCGKGNLAEVIYERNPGQLFCVELNPEMAKHHKDKPYMALFGKNFLSVIDEGCWDRIIMNPPFSRQQDIDHILHAFSLLRYGGILVSVVSESPFFRTNAKSVEFMTFLGEHNAEVMKLPEGAFKESGTMVKTRIIKVRKAGSELH